MGEGSIESRIHTLVSQKKAVFDQVFDGTSDSLRFEAASSLVARLGEMMPLYSTPAASSDASAGDVAPEDALDASTEAKVERAASDAAPAAAAAPDAQALFRRLRVDSRPDGSLRIEASGDAARTLGALLRGVADMLDGG